jgi:hypothetical protein
MLGTVPTLRHLRDQTHGAGALRTRGEMIQSSQLGAKLGMDAHGAYFAAHRAN